jgi:hypothetical protein
MMGYPSPSGGLQVVVRLPLDLQIPFLVVLFDIT